MSVVRNGPVLRRARAVAPSAALREDGTFLLVWAGKMGRQDRVDHVVRLADELVHERGRTDVRLVVLGDGECLDELRVLSSRLGTDPWVSFTGWVDEAAVFTHLASADLGLDTSLQEEVSPVKAMEYMTFGLPFVCFDLQESRRLAEGPPSSCPRVTSSSSPTRSSVCSTTPRRGAGWGSTAGAAWRRSWPGSASRLPTWPRWHRTRVRTRPAPTVPAQDGACGQPCVGEQGSSRRDQPGRSQGRSCCERQTRPTYVRASGANHAPSYHAPTQPRMLPGA